MNDYKSFTIQILNKYKCKCSQDEWKILPIHNGNKLIGFLKPITFFYNDVYPEYVFLINKWRTENTIGFTNVFENTIAKTEYWIYNLLLNREDRILFVVHTLDDVPIGHIGLSSFNFDDKNCEIDNVVRGVKETHKGIMGFATNSIIAWAREVLKIEDVYLKVLSDNAHAVEFYEKNGFVKQYDIPLYITHSKDIIEWIHLDDPQDRKPDRYYRYMKLIKKI